MKTPRYVLLSSRRQLSGSSPSSKAIQHILYALILFQPSRALILH